MKKRSADSQSIKQRLVNYLIDEVSLTTYAGLFLILIFAMASIYYLLSPGGNGISAEIGIADKKSFFDCVYFSVVTISTLGYGDIRPVGFSRLLSSIEVLLGMIFMGISIAKLTSRRLSYQVERLFASDAQKRLDDFSDRFSRVVLGMDQSITSLANEFQRTPSSVSNPGHRSDAIADFRRNLVKFHSVAIALADYFEFEIRRDNFFSLVASEHVRRVGMAANESVYRYSQIVVIVPAESKVEVFDGNSRDQTFEMINSLKSSAGLVIRHCKDSKTVENYTQLDVTCDGLLSGIFVTPAEALESRQPDQNQSQPAESQIPG